MINTIYIINFYRTSTYGQYFIKVLIRSLFESLKILSNPVIFIVSDIKFIIQASSNFEFLIIFSKSPSLAEIYHLF